MATLSCSSSSSPHIMLHRFVLRRSSTLPFTCQFSQHKQSFPTPISLKSSPFIRFSTTPQAVFSQEIVENVYLTENEEIEQKTIPSIAADGLVLSNIRRFETPLPNLTVKEKKELSSYAHSLGKKLKSQQVGKSGVTDTVIMALLETLEKNELLKLKIHNNCPMEFEDAVKQIQDGTSSVVVGQIGRTVILYRPSMTKLRAEEKKKQNRIDFLKKKSTPRPTFYQSRKPESGSGLEPRQLGHGRRGISRY